MTEKIWGIDFGSHAEAQKLAIPLDRRPNFDRGIEQLRTNPRQKPAHQLPDGTWRVHITQHITVIYAVSDFIFVIMMIQVTDDKNSGPEYLIHEDG